MPVGVTVITTTVETPAVTSSVDAATYFCVGLTERGSTTEAIRIRSISEMRTLIGNRVSYGRVYDDLQTYFAESDGNGRAYVARVVGTGAVTGTLTLKDKAGTPIDTIKLDANSSGAWSSQVSVAVEDTGGDTFKILVYLNGELVESYPGLSTPAGAVQALTISELVNATNMGSATVAPNNNPATLAATVLSAGDDKRASVATADYLAALDLFPKDLGPGAVAIPGQAATVTAAPLGTHGQETGRIALLAMPQGSTLTNAQSQSRTLRSQAQAHRMGLLWPWVVIPDGAGGNRTISPEGFAAGLRARAAAREGIWQPPAGETYGSAIYVTDLEVRPTADELDSGTDDQVTMSKVGPGGVQNYGWWSVDDDWVNWGFLQYQDTVNYIDWALNQAAERFVHRTIDGRGHLFTELSTDLTGVVFPIADQGGLFEGPSDPGFVVDTGPGVNTAATIKKGQIHAVVSVRLSPSAKEVIITLAKVPITALAATA